MSYKLVEKIIDSEGVFDPVSKLVLMVFARFAKDDGTNTYPSKTTVARLSGYSRNAIYQHIDKLLKLKFLIDTGEKRHFKRGYSTTIYAINVLQVDSVLQDDTVNVKDNPCHPVGQKVSSTCTQIGHGNTVRLSHTNKSGKAKGQAFEIEEA